jgi:hypothetical protein
MATSGTWSGRAGQAYRFVEHTVEPDRTLPVRCHLDGHRAFLVIQGEVKLEFPLETGGLASQRYGYLEGWHALEGSVYRVRTWVSSRAVLLEVGAARDDVRKTDGSVALHHKADAGSLRPVDAYTVNKRWGFEVWSTPIARSRRSRTRRRDPVVAKVRSVPIALLPRAAEVGRGGLTRRRSAPTAGPGGTHRTATDQDTTGRHCQTRLAGSAPAWAGQPSTPGIGGKAAWSGRPNLDQGRQPVAGAFLAQ